MRAAAFFDLDRTMMAGSSGIFFARAAYETGMINRRQLVRDLGENLRFRLRGSTDDWADAVRRRVGEMIAGPFIRDHQPLSSHIQNKSFASILDQVALESNTYFWSAIQYRDYPSSINLTP